MKRRNLVLAVVIALVAALLLWWHHAAKKGGAAEHAVDTLATAAVGVPAPHARRPDPRTVARASVAGTVSDDAHAPIAHARVCVDLSSNELPDELERDPRCTFSDDHGAYAIPDLYAAEVHVAAMAKGYLPAAYHPDGDRHRSTFELHAGEKKTGVDLVLHPGGVEITGTVSDIAGGPIGHASVRAHAGWWSYDGDYPAVDSDDDGKFTMWVRPGDVTVGAVADGYTRGEDSGRAPGRFEILLTPESSLSGTVVDAKTNAPVAGVKVEVSGSDGPWSSDGPTAFTDEAGRFRVTRLQPGRYVAVARSRQGFGHSDGSTRVGLAQHADGVVVKLYPAMRIEGRVVLPDAKKSTCKESGMWLHELDPERYLASERDPDGTLHIDGVLPGTYQVTAECRGYHAHDKYPPLVVKDKDLVGLEWEVDAGAVIKGRVLGKTGTPIEDADITARTVGGAAREQTGWSNDRSAHDGGYELAGLKPGDYKLEVSSDHGLGPKDGWKVSVPSAGAVVEKDLVLEDGGTIRGTVVDADGKPLSGVHVHAQSSTGSFSWGPGQNVRSSDDGSFTLEDLRPGDYRVIATRTEWGWGSGELRKPGTDDDAKQGERATVRAGETASVRLVVESTSGTIRGTVLDADGKPVSDAFVAASRESDAAGAAGANVEMTRWSSDDRPVLTGTDGSFTIGKLAPGKYTLLAQRKGGGEAVAEHVATGTTATLQMKRTGSLEGTVHRDGGPPDDVTIELADTATGYTRSERFFRTGGAYAIHELPAGHFTITCTAEGGQKQVTADLADGEHKTGVDIELDPLVTITGRVVELGTTTPAAGLYVFVNAGKNQAFQFNMGGDDDNQNVTDESGRFTIVRAPRGVVTITGFPKDWQDGPYGFLRTVRDIQGTGTIDIGDIGVVHRRVKPGDPVGELGVHFAEQPPGTPIDQHVWKVSWIDPAGPAAKSGLQVGDVITTIDGADVTGANAANGWMLLQAPPGTTVHLGLARGDTVAITLAAPS